MAGRKSDFTLTTLDDLFSTQEQRDDEKLSKIRDIPLEEIDDFPDHPFQVREDEDMFQLVESIKERGVITPAKKVFGLHIIMDFGANKTLTGGLALQTAETYKEFIGTSDISFGGNNFELYFEEDDFDKFADKLKEYDIEYVHPIMEHSWGQRVVRFYDPDKHIIEVGENMKVVCKRFLDSGMTPEQVAKRMDVPMKFVNACMR